jgi:hypothetical protein
VLTIVAFHGPGVAILGKVRGCLARHSMRTAIVHKDEVQSSLHGTDRIGVWLLS